MSTTARDPLSPEPILDLAHHFFAYTTVLAAIELRLFDALADRTSTEAEIRAELGLHPRLAADFLDSLVAIGLLVRDDGVYANAPLSHRYLRAGSSANVIRYLKGAQFRWQKLPEALRSGEPLVRGPGAGAQRATGGKSTGETMDNLRHDRDDWRMFFAWADYLSAARNAHLVRAVDWTGIVDFVDAGGGSGTAAAHLARHVPHLRATVFDLPNVRPAFDEQMAALGMTGRVTFRGGDFFTDPLPEADAILFGGMLIDWSEEQRRSMLRSAHRALRPGGIVLVGNHMLDDDRARNVASFMVSLNIMLVSTAGRVPLVGECRSWLKEAGFAVVHSDALGQLETLVVGRKEG